MGKKKEIEYIKVSYEYKTVKVLAEIRESVGYYSIIDCLIEFSLEMENGKPFFVGYTKNEKIKIPAATNPNYYYTTHMEELEPLLPASITKIGQRRIAEGFDKLLDLFYG